MIYIFDGKNALKEGEKENRDLKPHQHRKCPYYRNRHTFEMVLLKDLLGIRYYMRL